MTVLFYTVFISLMLVLPFVLGFLLRRCFAVPWWLFVIGMSTFVGSQVYHIPLNNGLSRLGLIGELGSDAPNLLRTAIVLGLSAGLSETIGRAIGFWLIRHKRPLIQKADSLLVGLGHGGIEAMIIGGVFVATSISALWGIRGADLSTLNISEAELPLVQSQLAAIESIGLINLAPFFERLLAMTLHVTLSLIVWQGIAHKRWILLVLAAGYHSLFDATAVYVAQQTNSIGTVYLILAALTVPLLYYLWQQWPHEEKSQTGQNIPFQHELRLYFVALRKELIQQWRTKRMLVVGAIFLLFGLGSPLLANLTPQLLQNIEGAEQFAELIPTPTNLDALEQYIRNITQFGFIIAVLLGMGAVAGEKEKESSVIILSKPLPRWAFVLSKFTAQALLYFASFTISSLGAYYYTLLLFEPFALGSFLFGNFLLFVWMLVFTAVTLLSSTIANSTSAAAGMALGGAIIFLILGTIPQISQLMPSGLIAWASQLGLATETAPNAGALASNILLILCLLITAVAVFEIQEL